MDRIFNGEIALALLYEVNRRIGAGERLIADQMLALYACAHDAYEDGIGGRDTSEATKETVLSDPRALEAALEGITWRSRAYAGEIERLVGARAAVPVEYDCEVLREVVLRRDQLGRALQEFGDRCASGSNQTFRARWESLSVAVRLTDEDAREQSINLLPIAAEIRARHTTTEEGGSVRAWWEEVEVPWWSDVMRWSKDGMPDEDIAETWLIPALNRAAARRDAGAGDSKS